ncbi:hypothetical protein TraAM80_06140 [Trypanosoma rangeli]|uniref:Uncharacterized protein n=1 Tax=Trypanosoma rangeli TaxID=5698 RepID=A0A422NBP1_TRYRA|nr:uncharacterized protein TraAM80_06140 [Trypanosoma rangeli]RNF02856.1 hypothetical protein TraAM80_06140 [Trypanosoma rangeli]|eukprot:RNF02856.1 hypothetical protein TraAM80_06140 [Trypanosoma rangeli]
MQQNAWTLNGTSAGSGTHVTYDRPLAVANEDYAVLGGVLGGLFLAAVYVLTLKIIDVCYRRKYRRGPKYDGVPLPLGQPRSGIHISPGWFPSVRHQVSIGSTGDGGAFSPRSSTQRRVRFDTEALDRVGNDTALELWRVDGQAIDAGRRDGNNETEWSYTRGEVYDNVPSPQPTAPPRQ